MREVTSAVIATSLVLISVFVPVSFFPGTTGILYKQFSLTIAFAIAISDLHARGDKRGDRDVAGADLGVCAGQLFPGNDGHFVQAVLADDCVCDCDFRSACAR